MDTDVERWAALINARAQQMDAAYARLGRTSADYWDRRARWFHCSTKESAAGDPFFLKVCSELTPETSVLDVGAGTGRFTLALAPLVRQVIAVEPNAAMLDYLRRDAREEGLTNITSLQTSWQDAPGELTADIVICSHVLYPIADIVPFLGRLHAATSTCEPPLSMRSPITSGSTFTERSAASRRALSTSWMYYMRWASTRMWKSYIYRRIYRVYSTLRSMRL